MTVSARPILISGRDRPLRASAIGVPVLTRASRIDATDEVSDFSRAIAQAPATCGAAIEVPELMAYEPPGTDEVIESPGASRRNDESVFE